MSIGNWNLIVGGINHKTASLEMREPLQISRDEFADVHDRLVDYEEILEAVVLSTCNRIEFYLVLTRGVKPFEIIKRFYSDFKETDISHLENKFYFRKNKHAADQIFRVTSGVDSMVLGENEILGQAKEAYSSACAVKSAGKIIHRLFHQAFRVGKEVRTDTEMGKGACSVSSAAIELLKTRLNEFERPVFLLVGVNQMISLAATSLAKLDYNNFIFANRTRENADLLAKRFRAESHSLDQLDNLLARADVCITCTGSSRPVVTRAMIDEHPESFEKPLLVLDMAVPRDTDFESDQAKGVEVLDLDNIQKFVRNQQEKRLEAVPEAEKIINHRMNEFMYWFNHVRHEPLYNGLEDTFEEIRQKELSPVFNNLPPDLKDEINRATRSMINKLLQVKVRASAKNGNTE
jgi:glutamyl-tRNA reductase